MKKQYILLVLLCIAAALVAGCMSTQTTNAAVTPTPQIIYVTVTVTPAPTPAPTAFVDPIVGSWSFLTSNGLIDQPTFYADGTFSEYWVNPQGSGTFAGTWQNTGSGSYTYAVSNGKTGSYTLVAINELHDNSYNLDYYRLGTAPSESVVTAAPTAIIPSGYSHVTTLSGNGDDTQPFSITSGGGFIIAGSNSGNSNFIVHITDTSGNVLEYLFNEIGPYSGNKIVNLDTGNYYMSVEAEGPWTITLTPS